MLHELDREMERQGLRFVRYADDFSIYCKTKQEARTAGNAIFLFLKHKLKLEINRDKSGIRRPVHFQILGYGFVLVYRSIRQKLVEIDGWLRNRLRYCIWIPMMISGEETREEKTQSDSTWSGTLDGL